MERSHQIHVTQNTAACMNMLKTCTGLHVHVIDLIKQTVITTSSKSILEFAQMTMQKDMLLLAYATISALSLATGMHIHVHMIIILSDEYLKYHSKY